MEKYKNNKGQTTKKQIPLKASKILLAIGVCLLIFGIIFTINAAKTYKESYDKWYNEWWNYHTADLNDQPMPFKIIIGVIMIFFSLPIIFSGLRPYIIKLSSKIQAETLEYAGKDISNVGMKTVDVAKPVINKGVDEVVAPSIKKVVKEINDVSKNYDVCPKCGDKIEDDEEFCSNCGIKLTEFCPQCGYKNNLKAHFCKKCGAKL